MNKKLTQEKLTQERLKELLTYDPDTGELWWTEEARPTVAGKKAGCLDNAGYRVIQIDFRTYKAHRLAFLYMEGYFPEHQVDHINRIKDDNRWVNLREVSARCNRRNSCGNKKRKKSLPKGVKLSFKKMFFECRIQNNTGKQRYLGHYRSLGDACAARFAAEQCLGYLDCDSCSEAGQWLREILAGEREDLTLKKWLESYGKK